MNKRISSNQKRLHELLRSQIPLNNDVFMVFANNKSFCQEFLRVILQDKKLIVIDNEIQKYLPSAFNKNETVDMLCELNDGSVVNVEIQLENENTHARRIFKYASKIKSYLIEKGAKYKDLKDIIEIYLTKQDIFKKGSTVYEVDMNIVSDQNEIIGKWDAGLRVYYVNTEGLTNKNINKYLKLLTDKTTISKKYKHTSSIKQEIYEIGGVTMSKEMRAILDDERAEGKAEGRAEGKVEGKIESFLSLVKKGLLELSVAAKELGMSESQFEKLVNN